MVRAALLPLRAKVIDTNVSDFSPIFGLFVVTLMERDSFLVIVLACILQYL